MCNSVVYLAQDSGLRTRRLRTQDRRRVRDHGDPHPGARGDGPDPSWGQILSDEARETPRDPVCMLLHVYGRLNTGVSANWAYISTTQFWQFQRQGPCSGLRCQRAPHGCISCGKPGSSTALRTPWLNDVAGVFHMAVRRPTWSGSRAPWSRRASRRVNSNIRGDIKFSRIGACAACRPTRHRQRPNATYYNTAPIATRSRP